MKRILIILTTIFLIGCEEDPIMYTLTVSSNPTEGGTINPSSGEYQEGTEVTLRVNTNTNYEFNKWSGSWSGSESPLTITMDSDKNIVGNFKLMDSDGDGVTDSLDQCNDTPSGQTVGSNGCSDSQKDSDEDGVNDDVDTCPDTPSDEEVNETGCSSSQVDTDSDGVMDDMDNCPDTPEGEEVDENGCSDSQKDTDEDGVTDDVDQCPDTPEGEEVDENGCSSSQVDTDGDGVMDDMDNCPDTPEGEGVDENGCSVDNNSGGNIYVAGYISDGAGNTTACYWKNGERVDLFTGELEDLVVVDGIVYSVGWTYGGSSYYWVGNESFELEGSGVEAYAIAVHDGDVYTAGRDNAGACYWKNTKKTSLSGGDSSGYGISVSDDGDVFVGGYYQNKHHYVIPAKWKNGSRSNLSRPSGGDGEVQDVVMVDGTPYYFGMTLKPDNQVGLIPKASYWYGNNRTDLTNGGGFDEMIDGGQAYGGFVDGADIYVAGKISHFGQYCADCPNKTKPGTGGDIAHYWYNGNIFDLPGGVWTDGWTSTAYDIAVKDDLIVASGYVATGTETQVPAIWINGELTKLEGDNTYGVAKAVFID